MLRAGGESYFYVLDQFKGMRQDCTVQHLRNALTVRVYEAHARAALEYGDVPEYNQCQTQLAVLHGEGLSGAHAEFLAYRVLYQTAHARQGERVALLQTLRLAMGPARCLPSFIHLESLDSYEDVFVSALSFISSYMLTKTPEWCGCFQYQKDSGAHPGSPALG